MTETDLILDLENLTLTTIVQDILQIREVIDTNNITTIIIMTTKITDNIKTIIVGMTTIRTITITIKIDNITEEVDQEGEIILIGDIIIKILKVRVVLFTEINYR